MGIRVDGFSMSFTTSSDGEGRGCARNLALICVHVFCLNAEARTPLFSVMKKDALCGSWKVTGKLSVPASSTRLLILT